MIMALLRMVTFALELISVFWVGHVQTTTPVQGQSLCMYDFKGPADVIFLMDTSRSVNSENFDNFKAFMARLVQKTMLIGPESNSEYVRLAAVLFNSSGVVTALDMTSGSNQVYEAEFFSEKGLFEQRIRFDVTGSPYTNTVAEAFNHASLIARSSLTTVNNHRRQIVIVATDAHFDSDKNGNKKAAAKDAIAELRRTVLTYNGTLVMYGVGLGTYYNESALRGMVDEAYGSATNTSEVISEECRVRDLKNWNEIVNDMPSHIQKDTFGPTRAFADRALCCQLCFSGVLEGDDVPSRCSASEFDSTTYGTFKCEQPTGPQDSCDALMERTTMSMTSTKTEDDDDGDDDNGSYLLILFAIVNLVLIVMFILVAIFAPRITQKKPKRLSSDTNPRHITNKSTNRYEDTTPGNISGVPVVTATPTRPAPKPPTHLVCPRPQPPGRVPPSPNQTPENRDQELGNNARGSVLSTVESDWDGEVNFSSEHEENTYNNIYSLHDVQRRHHSNTDHNQRPKTILDAFKEDYMKFRKRISGRYEHDEEGSVSQISQGSEIPGRRQSRNPLKKFLINRRSRHYTNSDTIQAIHDERARQHQAESGAKSHTNVHPPQQASSSGMDNELELKLKQRRLKSASYQAQVQPDIIMDTTFANSDVNQDTNSDDYENQDVINELHENNDQLYQNVNFN